MAVLSIGLFAVQLDGQQDKSSISLLTAVGKKTGYCSSGVLSLQKKACDLAESFIAGNLDPGFAGNTES